MITEKPDSIRFFFILAASWAVLVIFLVSFSEKNDKKPVRACRFFPRIVIYSYCIYKYDI